MATASGVFAVDGFSVLDQVARGPMQEHREMKSKVSRGWYLAQNGPCLLVKAAKLVCCPMKSIRQQSNYKLDENNH